MRVLGLDCASNLGWALFSASGAAPMCGTWRAPKSWSPEDYGSRFRSYHDWLCDMLTVHEPDVVAFESPVTGAFGSAVTNEHTLRFLIGLASITELIAALRQVRCLEINVSTAKKALTGNGRAEKSEMLVAATRRGFGCADHNQADACAVGLVAYGHLEG